MGKKKSESSILDVIRSVDSFGQKVSSMISFKKKDKYQTLCGSFVTFLMIFLLVSYFYIDFTKVYNGET
jgi:predicted PurR-regulated permease PerM